MFSFGTGDDTKTEVKSIIGVALALTLTAVLCVVASVIHGVYLPFISLAFFLVSPAPYFLCAKHRGDSSNPLASDDQETGINQFGEFLAAGLGTIGLVLPWLLYRNDQIQLDAAILTFLSGIVLYGAIMIIEVIRANRKKSSAFG